MCTFLSSMFFSSEGCFVFLTMLHGTFRLPIARIRSTKEGNVFTLFVSSLGGGVGVPQSLVPGPFPASGPRSFPGGGTYLSLWFQVLSWEKGRRRGTPVRSGYPLPQVRIQDGGGRGGGGLPQSSQVRVPLPPDRIQQNTPWVVCLLRSRRRTFFL